MGLIVLAAICKQPIRAAMVRVLFDSVIHHQRMLISTAVAKVHFVQQALVGDYHCAAQHKGRP